MPPLPTGYVSEGVSFYEDFNQSFSLCFYLSLSIPLASFSLCVSLSLVLPLYPSPSVFLSLPLSLLTRLQVNRRGSSGSSSSSTALPTRVALEWRKAWRLLHCCRSWLPLSLLRLRVASGRGGGRDEWLMSVAEECLDVLWKRKTSLGCLGLCPSSCFCFSFLFLHVYIRTVRVAASSAHGRALGSFLKFLLTRDWRRLVLHRHPHRPQRQGTRLRRDTPH